MCSRRLYGDGDKAMSDEFERRPVRFDKMIKTYSNGARAEYPDLEHSTNVGSAREARNAPVAKPGRLTNGIPNPGRAGGWHAATPGSPMMVLT